MIRAADKDEPAKDLLRSSPQRKHVKPDGTIVVEKLCSIPFHWKAVDLDGNVVPVALANGTTDRRRRFLGNDYGQIISDEKPKKGFLWFHQCPYATGAVPLPEDNDKLPKGQKIVPCQGIDGRGTLIEQHKEHLSQGCSHLRAIAMARRAVKKRKNDKINDTHKPDDRRLLDQLKRFMSMSIADPKGSGGMPL